MTIINNAEIHLGDIGTQIQIQVVDEDLAVIDIGTATTKEITMVRPSGAKTVYTAAFPSGGDGSDGLMEYITIADTLDESGVWKIQGYVEFPSGSWHTEIDSFQVVVNL